MKTTIFKTFTLCLLATISIQAFSQPLISEMPVQDALRRVRVFKMLKRDIIENLNVRSYGSFSISRQDFIGYLDSLSSNYDGVRVYFIFTANNPEVQEENRGKIGLLFMPTIESKEKDSCGDFISRDVEKDAYIILKDKFIPVTNFIHANALKDSFELLVKRAIETTIRTEMPFTLEEAKSLWYSKAILFDPVRTDSLCLQEYLKRHAEIDSVKIQLASFFKGEKHKKDLSYKMDIIYSFNYVDKSLELKYFSLGIKEIMSPFNKDKKLIEKLTPRLSTLYANTGLPCPPNKCP